MTYYYRKSNKDNFEEDIKDLNNKIDTIYTSLSNIIEERNNLLQIFNSRIPNELKNSFLSGNFCSLYFLVLSK